MSEKENENTQKNMKDIPSDHTNKILDKKRKDLEIHTRPNASPGFWLCTLLPLCYSISTYRYPKKSSTFEYRLTTIIAIGFNLQSICFFLYLNFKSNQLINMFYTFISSVITSLLIYHFVKQNSFNSIVFGFLIIFIYQYFHVKIFKLLPKSFTLGEASIVLQGLFLFVINSILQIPKFIKRYPRTELIEMQSIMMTALFALIIFGLLLFLIVPLRHPICFYLLLICYVLFVSFVPVTKDLPIITIWKFVTSDSFRIIFIGFCVALVGITAIIVNLLLNKSEKATTIIRKYFHIILVLVYIPGLLYQCTLLYIASGIVLAFLILFEILRLIKIPPFHDILSKMTEIFVDEKDSGYIALTQIYLLIGCSLPLWINPSPCSIKYDGIQLLSGIISIGIGDTAASIFGSKLGKSKWPGTNKSIEGTTANVISQSLTVILLIVSGYVQMTTSNFITIPLAIVITSFVEAFTDQVDNIVLPLVFYIISSLT